MGPGVTFDLAASLTIGFLGSFHCLGMCGPLLVAYSLYTGSSLKPTDQDRLSNLGHAAYRHAAFHSGRLLIYGLLGALAGLLFYLADLNSLFLRLRSGMTLLGGVLMILLGLVLIRAVHLPELPLFSFPGAKLHALFRRLVTSQDVPSKMLLGMAVGFLPCGLSWAMIVKAATTHNPIAGFLTMTAFGLGTVPALLLPGMSASVLSLKFRLVGDKLAALSVIAMGLILISKGAKFFA